jgi:hypothetical protein
MTTAAYQKATNRKAFETFVTTNYEALTGFGTLREDFFAPDTGTTYVLKKKAHVGGGFKDVTITMIKEGTNWKVDQLTVLGSPIAPGE